jgi:Glycosyl transferase family 11
MKYVYPVFDGYDFSLFRIGGPGLGNLLFPWARALIYSEAYSARLVRPTWPQLKIGPFIRREFDSRMYIGVFKNSSIELNGIDRIKILALAKKYNEFSIERYRLESRDCILTTCGMGRFFEPLVSHRTLLLDRLRSYKAGTLSARKNVPFAAVHVRLGDFSVLKTDSFHSGIPSNTRLPLDWYVNKLDEVKKNYPKLDFYVFSDGNDDQLKPILERDKTVRILGGDALDDLLLMSQASLMICSNSTFSAWGAFLADCVSIWHPNSFTYYLPKAQYK